jgi:hypothetical protein
LEFLGNQGEGLDLPGYKGQRITTFYLDTVAERIPVLKAILGNPELAGVSRLVPMILVLLFPVLCWSQMQYDENVWVSYSSFRQVTDVAVGRNFVYISTTGGVLRWDLYKRVWDFPWVIVRGREASIDLRSALNVDYLPETDQVAVLTSRGAFLYEPTARVWEPTQREFYPAGATELNQAIFLEPPGTTVTGRNYFPQGSSNIMDRELHQHPLGAFAADNFGFWWIGVEGVGVLQLDSRMLRGTMWEMGLYGTNVRAMVRGGGWIILGGNNPTGGISIWKPEASIWDHLEPRYNAGLQSGIVSDLEVTGHLALAATDFGMTQFDLRNGTGRTWRVVEGLWSDHTNGVAAERDTAWVATENGVNYITLPKGPCKRLNVEGIKNVHAYRIAVDPQALWVGTDLGLFRMDRTTGQGEYLGQEGGVGGPVTALFSGAEELWAGRVTGLEVIKKQNLGQTGFPAQAFFAGAQIFDILPVDSLVYIASDRGLWKLDRYRNRWHQYLREDGLISNHVNALLRDGDYLLIGTSEGVTRFFWNDPSRID